MSYEEFTLEQINLEFSLAIEENVSLFTDVEGVQLDEFFLYFWGGDKSESVEVFEVE